MSRKNRWSGRAFALEQCLNPLEPRLLLSAVAQGETVQRALTLFESSPALFVENRGQWADESVRYVHSGSGANVAMTNAGPVFQLFRDTPSGPPVHDGPSVPGDAPSPLKLDPQPGAVETLQFSASFVGANAAIPIGRDRSDSTFNYLLGDRSTWRSDVAAYTSIVYDDLYDGIDLHTWGLRSHLKYEFHVAPGSDHSPIQITYAGIESLSLADDGSLVVNLGNGWSPLIDAAPYVYQDIDGQRVEVESRYVLVDERTYGFELGEYDTNYSLVIDPELAWEIDFGGTGHDSAGGIGVDSTGNVLITGNTRSSGWVSGGFDEVYSHWDAFVVKLDPEGTHLWSTYLGGANVEFANEITTDGNGNVLIAGETESAGWVSGGFDITKDAGFDAFLVKLDPNGNHIWSTFLGGTGTDRAFGVAVDDANNVVITGDTTSDGWIAGGFDTVRNGPDAFVAKLSSDGVPVWSTYLGGREAPDGFNDSAASVAVDSTGSVLVTGQTGAPGWITGGWDTTFTATGEFQADGYVIKLSSAGQHIWSSYLGGIGFDFGSDIAADGDGNVLITGATESPGWVAGGYDTSRSNVDGFLVKMNSNGGHLWSTYLGGSGNDYGYGVAVDSKNNVVVSGSAESDSSWVSGGWDPLAYFANIDGWPFVVKLTSTGHHHWSGYFNAVHSGVIAVDAEDQVLFASSVQPILDRDVFVAKITPTLGPIDVQLDRPISFVDVDGTRVTVSVKGGEGHLQFTGDDLVVAETPKSITVRGNNIAVTEFVVDNAVNATMTVTATGGDKRVTFGALTVNGSAARISMASVDVAGDLLVIGLAASVSVGSMSGQHSVILGGLPENDPTKLVFGHLADVTITSGAPVQLSVLSWTDTDPDINPDSLTAPYATTIAAVGDKKNSIVGAWQADVTLSGQGAVKETLKSFKAQSLSDSIFSITGSVGTFDVSKGAVSELELMASADIASIKLGDVADSTVEADDIGTLQAIRWIDGQITADTLKTLKVIGDKKTVVAGDMNASLTILGDPAVATALNAATIAGELTGQWQIGGAVGSITVAGEVGNLTLAIEGDAKTVKLGDVSGSSLIAEDVGTLQAIRWLGGQIAADSLKTLKVTGNSKTATPGDMSAAVTVTGNPAILLELGTASIAGLLSGQWNITGPVGTITAGDVAGLTGNVIGAVNAFNSKASLSGLLAAFSFAKIDVKTHLSNAKLIAGGGAASFINSLKIGGNVSNASILAGVDPVNGIFDDGDDVLVGGPMNTIKSMSIGGTTDVNTPMFFAGLFPASISINKIKTDPQTDPRFVVTPV